MEIIDTIETAAGTAVAAIEHPFHTIGARLTEAWRGLESFFGHPYCAPPLQDALTTLHGVVGDLAQEVAELRRPCTDCTGQASASTSAAGGDAAPEPHAEANAAQAALSAADLADFRAWQHAKIKAALFTGTV